MRYDDPERPQSEAQAERIALQVNKSPLPVITLIRPMESEGEEVARCSQRGDNCGHPGGFPCERCALVREPLWGWLACIHAHRESARYSYHTGWIRDLGAFSQEYLEDPEKALAKYFKYFGPEERQVAKQLKPKVVGTTPDLWGADE